MEVKGKGVAHFHHQNLENLMRENGKEPLNIGVPSVGNGLGTRKKTIQTLETRTRDTLLENRKVKQTYAKLKRMYHRFTLPVAS